MIRSFEILDGVGILRLKGKLNFEHTSEIRIAIIEDLINLKSLIVDLTEVTDIDSSGLGLLIATKNKLPNNDLRLFGLQTRVRHTFKTVNFLSYFSIFEIEEDARRKLCQ
jgi:anti-anti-sigma factor